MKAAIAKQNFEHAMNLLHLGDPVKAADVCRSSLISNPNDADFLTLLGAALLACKQPADAVDPLRQAVNLAPQFPLTYEYLGQALIMLNQLEDAIDQLQRAAVLDPGSNSIRTKIGHALAASGRGEEADKMYEQAFGLAPDRQRLAEAGEKLNAGKVDECADICRDLLKSNPDDVNALRLLAKVAGEKGRWGRAEQKLLRVLELAPAFLDARIDLARVYKQQDRFDEAVAVTADAMKRSPHNAHVTYMHASMLAVALRFEEALEAYRLSIELRPYHPAAYVGMGHLLKTLGRQQEGIDAYRKAIEQRPNFGEVYWSLANLKTFRFTDAEIQDMDRRLAEQSLDEEARVHFLFALGKAREDQGQFQKAFEHYDQACEIQRMKISYDPVETRVVNQRIRSVFTADLITRHKPQWQPQPMPIFIVGLPRSGSTLIEQILSSHSQVEGTAELPDVGKVIGSLSSRSVGPAYPEAVQQLDEGNLRELGEAYLRTTQRHRRGSPYFTDKMPNNFPSIGLIHLMLPNAKIIDARRHPLDSCFGTLKQHFAHGQTFSYDLFELGEYYREYRSMMRHWDEVLPGRVLEVRYEELVNNQEEQTRRLLEYCGLPFEESCLRFYETERAVRTASSEQVRQPIFSTSVNHWRNFRTELAPLIEMLGDELEGWDS
ncbi:MAG: tetratricopeptide (TPR) repeat protein [Lysobacterales bacterium]|jgi:tetratricopeptide (TPR) repeat protein